MIEKKTKLDYIKYRREKAFETFDEIEKLIDQGMLANAINRIYYSGFYIISSLALFDNFSTSKHRQLIGFFIKEYVKTNKIDETIGLFIDKAYNNRIASDYHDFVYLTKTDIEEYYQKMKVFIQEIDRIIQEKLSAFSG